MRFVLSWLLASVLFACTPKSVPIKVPSIQLTHGVASGDVSPTRAVVWARCAEATTVHVSLRAEDGSLLRDQQTPVSAEHDMIGKIAFAGLQPGQHYTYRVWCGASDAAAQNGTFAT